MLRERIARAPQDVEASRVLAEIAARREDYAEAERLLAECLKLAPEDNRARFDLVQVLYAQHKAASMLPLVENLTVLEPANPSYRVAHAAACSLLGENDHAMQLLSDLITEFPDDSQLLIYLGHALRAAGQSDDAILAYQQASQRKPDLAEAWLSLADIKTFRFNAVDVTTLRSAVARRDLNDNERWKLEFALGRAFEDQGEFSASFAHYIRGNALRRSQLDYDSDDFTAIVKRAQTLYTRDFFNARADWGSRVQEPIFVIGVPRSGSTLIEQILASHSQVEGTGELPDVVRFAVEVWLGKDLEGRRPAYPLGAATLSRQDIDAFAARYLTRTREHRVLGRPRFVDRMLSNFVHLGLIHLMFPNAAIIDTRRHPLACCLSCYTQVFGRGAKFAYDLQELGRYYRDYVALMEHFDVVLPGRVHRVCYEELVSDPQREIAALLDYCGLSFEPECLKFYQNPRTIHSISSEQVRRPIYTDSVNHWRKYESWLGPLKETLGDTVARYRGRAPLSGH